MDVKFLVGTLQKIEVLVLDKPILIFLHLIINNLDRKSKNQLSIKILTEKKGKFN